LSAPKVSDRLYLSQIDVKTPTPSVYKRGTTYRVLTRPDGKRKVMRRFASYEEAVAYKATVVPVRSVSSRHASPRTFIPRMSPRVIGRYMASVRRDPCAYCGESSDHIDHIEPVAGDGPNDWANYTAACRRCNLRKSAKPLLVFLARENGCWEWRSST
jgi:5-methylcytosine-specific restriction endonuclease McrA